MRFSAEATLFLRSLKQSEAIRDLIVAACLIGACGPLPCQRQKDSTRPVESEHVAGPHGLEGWTLNGPIPDDYNHEDYPFELIVARRGKVIRRIEGDAFVWHWIFWDDGRKIAYESGPLHFSLACNLYDIAKGRVIASVDCFQGIPDNAPDWLQTLEDSK